MTGHNPTDRSKLGSKRHILTDKCGIPLSVIITSANTHDVTVAIDTVDSMVLKRSSSQLNDRKKQNLCLDKAYHSKEVEQEIFNRGYIPHIRHRREEKLFHRTHPAARRWVVERTHSWMNRFRRLLIRWEKKEDNYIAILHFVCAWITYKRGGVFG